MTFQHATPLELDAGRLTRSRLVRPWFYGALALIWFAVSAVGSLGLPSFATVVVLGLLVMLSVEPDARTPNQTIAATRRNLVLAAVGVAAFIPPALGMNLLLGKIRPEWGHDLIGVLAALCVVLPRLAETRRSDRPLLLGQRELILAVAAVVAFAASYRAGDMFVSMVAVAVVAPIVMAVRRIRFRDSSFHYLQRRRWALQAVNFWLLVALVGGAGLSGALYVWQVVVPGSEGIVLGGFWLGLAAAASLALFPRRRISVLANVLIALLSIFIALQLVRINRPPVDATTLELPFAGEWAVVSGGRSTLVNSHWSLEVQRNAIDIVEIVNGKSYRGDRSRLESFYIFGEPLLAVSSGRVTWVVDSRTDLPVGGATLDHPEGNSVVLDIGDGRYVLYAHLEQGSARVQVGDRVRRGQVIGHVGDSGNSDEPHLHIQVQNKPEFDLGSRDLETYPILFRHATVSDVRRGDSVRALPQGDR